MIFRESVVSFHRRFGLGIAEKDLERNTHILRCCPHHYAYCGIECESNSQSDDIDHLGFRRVRFAGELLGPHARGPFPHEAQYSGQDGNGRR